MMDRASVEAWISDYERAWRTAGTDSLRELFAEHASYRMSPYDKPAVGLEAIGELWERERVGPDERFEIKHEVVAVDGDTAVARIEVTYATGTEYRDVWIIRFAADGRCREFEEWPFWPGQPVTLPTPPSP
ncbi:MAG: nuclear transport factor 2 family protein [Solirubrobacterales bacterium]